MLAFFLLYIQNILPIRSVESFSEPFLIDSMSDKSDTSGKQEEPVKYPCLDVELLFIVVHTDILEYIQKHRSDVSVDIEDEIGLFFEGEFCYLSCKIKMLVNWKILCQSFKNLTARIRIKLGFYFVPDSRDIFSSLFHTRDKVFG